MNEFLTCSVMQSVHICSTTKRGGFAHCDLEPLVNEFLTCNALHTCLTAKGGGFAHSDL